MYSWFKGLVSASEFFPLNRISLTLKGTLFIEINTNYDLIEIIGYSGLIQTLRTIFIDLILESNRVGDHIFYNRLMKSKPKPL